MQENIYVTKSSMPSYEEYVDMIKPLWDTHCLTNMGEYHKKLECQLKEYLHIDHISLITNGHMALEMAIQAMNLTGEVITTPFTFVSTIHAIKRNGLTPVFCDINEKDFTIDVTKIEKLITKRTCAIVPVHVFGRICDVEGIEKIARKHNLKVIYDAAHAFGVSYKGINVVSYGDASILSFHATKVFNTVEGGAVVYHSDDFGSEIYSLKNFGIRNEELIDGIGANAKMDELRAIMGICNLAHINDEIKKREQVYKGYIKRLEGIQGITLPYYQEHVTPNYSYFPILFDKDVLGKNRDEIYGELKKYNIFARKYFYPLINDTECYKQIYSSKETPIAKKISESILTIPMYADLTEEDLDRVCNALIECIRGGK